MPCAWRLCIRLWAFGTSFSFLHIIDSVLYLANCGGFAETIFKPTSRRFYDITCAESENERSL